MAQLNEQLDESSVSFHRGSCFHRQQQPPPQPMDNGVLRNSYYWRYYWVSEDERKSEIWQNFMGKYNYREMIERQRRGVYRSYTGSKSIRWWKARARYRGLYAELCLLYASCSSRPRGKGIKEKMIGPSAWTFWILSFASLFFQQTVNRTTICAIRYRCIKIYYIWLGCFWFLCVGLCHQDAVHITAILGESVVFNCHVEFPGEHPVPYVLQWEKKVGEMVRYRTTPSLLSIRELNTRFRSMSLRKWYQRVN